MADEVEQRLVQELHDATAEDLGQVDTFRFEDRKVMAAALEGLAHGRYSAVYDWAIERKESFWAREDASRKRAWQLVLRAASLGLALLDDADLLDGVASHADAVERYAQRGFRVDAAQRQLEQARQQASVLEIEEFSALRERMDGMRVAYRAWADKQAHAFNALCAAQGFLPAASLRQRELFEEVVRPMTQQPGVTAYFTVDALRFELAEQLQRELLSTGTGALLGGWKVIADDFQLRVEGDGVTHQGLLEIIERMRTDAFWTDRSVWGPIYADLPEYRLSKFQKAMPAGCAEEMIARYLLDVEGARRLVQSAKLKP